VLAPEAAGVLWFCSTSMKALGPAAVAFSFCVTLADPFAV